VTDGEPQRGIRARPIGEALIDLLERGREQILAERLACELGRLREWPHLIEARQQRGRLFWRQRTGPLQRGGELCTHVIEPASRHLPHVDALEHRALEIDDLSELGGELLGKRALRFRDLRLRFCQPCLPYGGDDAGG